MTTSLRVTSLIAAAFVLVAAAARSPADPTFSEDIAPIAYKNCTSCHRSGGLAPFSMIEYDSTTPYLDKMKDAVESGAMPPWHAEGPRGVFRNDRRLSDAEKALIIKWLDTGAKEGDKAKLPPKPVYPSAWTIGNGKPDLIVPMPEDYTVPASGTVEYMYFEAPTNLTEEKWVQSIEILPGAREVVHHVLVYARVPAPPAQPAAPAAAAVPGGAPTPTTAPTPVFIRSDVERTPPPSPRKDSLHRSPRVRGPLIGSTAPGMNVVEFPAGTALRLRPGTVITFQMHYTTHGVEHKDRSAIGFTFAKETPNEEIFANQFINGQFTIPAGAKDVAVNAEIGIGQPVKIYGMLPHTHLRGTRWQYSVTRPDGTSEIVLDVPRYDFNWQTYYLFNKPLELAPGSKLTSTAWYDNSPSNKSNPNPTVDVKWGDQTWEEMQYTGILYSVPGRRIRP